MHNWVENFSDFTGSLNEGNSYKREYGILGPFSPWGYKIKACCPENGGVPSEGKIIISGMGEDDEEVGLKYLYGEGKESDPIYIPKKSLLFGGTFESPIIQTKIYTKWWDDEKNQDEMDEFVNSFIESKHFEIEDELDAEGDICCLIEVLGIDSDLTRIEKKKDLHWNAYLKDGMEVEMKKRDKDNLFKVLKLYLSQDSYSPEVEICHEKPGYEVVYSTPKGKFARKCSTIGDIPKDPVHQYLFTTSMKKDPSLYQDPVISYLNTVLKNHDWNPQGDRKSEDFIDSEREIIQIKKILSNSVPEKDLDEIYSQAREKYRFPPGKSEN